MLIQTESQKGVHEKRFKKTSKINAKKIIFRNKQQGDNYFQEQMMKHSMKFDIYTVKEI